MPINKSLTIDGNHHTVTVKGRGFAPGKNASSNIDVTFKDISIQNSTNAARCIDTRGHIGKLTLDNAKLDTQGATGQWVQTLTIGGSQSTATDVIIKNGSIIQTNENATAHYAITTFNPVNMTITGSTLSGYAALYLKGPDDSEGSHGSVVNISNSTIYSRNIYPGTTNEFAAIALEDHHITINITNSELNVEGGSNKQAVVSFNNSGKQSPYSEVNLGENNTVNLTGDYWRWQFNKDKTSAFNITGGTFNADPNEFCAPGFGAAKSGNTWTVQSVSGVASIDATGYNSLEAAVNAAQDDQTIRIHQPGNYSIPNITKDLTIIAAASNVVVEHTTDAAITTIASGKTATFKNITFELGSAVETAQAHGFGTLYGNNGALVMDGCTVNGSLNLFGESTFTNCVFTASGIYNIWAVNDNANFTGCTFNNTNRAVNVYDQKHTGTEMSVSFTDCTFSASQKRKAAVNIHHNPKPVGTPAKFAVSINNCETTGIWAGTVAETGEPDGETICNSTLWMISDIKDWTAGDITVSVNGTPVTTWDGTAKAALTAVDANTYAIYTAPQLAQFAYDVNNGTTYAGKTVKLMNNIDLNNKAWTPIGETHTALWTGTNFFKGTFDGNHKTVSNFTVTKNTNNNISNAGFFGTIEGAANESNSVTIKDLTINNATISGNHHAGGIVAHVELNSTGSNSVTISGCTVTGSTITTTPWLNGSNYDDGNQAGGIVGIAYQGRVSIVNNTVTNTTVTGFRDIGGIAGCLSVMSGNTFTGNIVDDITVTQSKTNEYSTSDVKKKTVGTILGRIMQGDNIDISNTATGNNNVTVQYDTEVRYVGYRVD